MNVCHNFIKMVLRIRLKITFVASIVLIGILFIFMFFFFMFRKKLPWISCEIPIIASMFFLLLKTVWDPCIDLMCSPIVTFVFFSWSHLFIFCLILEAFITIHTFNSHISYDKGFAIKSDFKLSLSNELNVRIFFISWSQYLLQT